MLVWKGEDELPPNSYINVYKEWKARNKIWLYFWFIRNYLCLFDYWAIIKKFRWYSLTDKSFLIWKIKLWKPYYYKYYAKQPQDYYPREKLDFIDFDDTGYFMQYRFKVPCYGAWTVSLYTTLYQKERQLRREWLVRYLTIMFGERFTKYYNSLPEHEKQSLAD